MSNQHDRAQAVREQIRLSLAREVAERSAPVIADITLAAAVARLAAL